MKIDPGLTMKIDPP